jgi:hypothetical protein
MEGEYIIAIERMFVAKDPRLRKLAYKFFKVWMHAIKNWDTYLEDKTPVPKLLDSKKLAKWLLKVKAHLNAEEQIELANLLLETSGMERASPGECVPGRQG